MSMNREFNIEALVADLTPVRTVQSRIGVALTLAAATAASLWVGLWYGLRADIVAGAPDPLVLLRAGALLLLGLATLLAVSAAARPTVGQRHNGWVWALAAALLFPLAAAIMLAWTGKMPIEELSPTTGRYCLQITGISAIGIGGVLTAWLRTGAPTNIERSGWLVGLASGSLGALAYSLHCPMANIYYIGLWYTLAVGLAAVAGRLIVPHIIRW